jgi:hypothetical protein
MTKTGHWLVSPTAVAAQRGLDDACCEARSHSKQRGKDWIEAQATPVLRAIVGADRLLVGMWPHGISGVRISSLTGSRDADVAIASFLREFCCISGRLCPHDPFLRY